VAFPTPPTSLQFSDYAHFVPFRGYDFFNSALLEHVVPTACERSRVAVFPEGQPIARSDVLRRRRTSRAFNVASDFTPIEQSGINPF